MEKIISIDNVVKDLAQAIKSYLIEQIEGMKKEEGKSQLIEPYIMVYNQALDEVKKMIGG